MDFSKLCKKSPPVIKYVTLLFLKNKEIAKVALVCKVSNKAVDSNSYSTEGEMEMHLQVVL